jgi:ABC-type transporter Mla MlaB component
MLKITVTEDDRRITLVLEGRLCGPCAAEAERSCRTAMARARNHKILLDLTGVTFVGGEGEVLLAEVLEQGAEIRVDGVLMSHLVEELRERISNTTGAVSSRRTPSRIAAPAYRKTLALPQVQGSLRET